MKDRIWKSVGLLIILTMLFAGLAACGPTPEPEVVVQTVVVEKEVEGETITVIETVEVEVTTQVEKEVVVTATPAPTSKVITFAWTQEPDYLNPYYTNMWFSTVLHQLYSCWAWEYDDENAAFPKLITEMPTMGNGGLSEDGTVITLNLRDDLVWSDGTPLTADDFVFTYEMIVNPANTVASVYPYDMLDSVEATDPQTVVMTFAEPFASWQANFWRGILPKHVMQPIFDAEGTIDEADSSLLGVGCGPYVVDTWESGSYIRLVKSPNYWLGEPKIEEIFFQFVPDDASQTASMIAGTADVGTFPPLSDVPTLEAGGLEIMVQSSGYAEGIFFNFGFGGSPAAADVNVRQAVAMAIDRDAINEDLLLGLTSAPETLWDPLEGGFWVSPEIEPWQYDPEAAKALLEDAGWIDTDDDGIREKDGERLSMVYGTTIREIRQDAQAVIQQMLRDVGIEVQIPSWDADLFFASYADGSPCALGEVDMMEWSDSTLFPDPDHYYWNCSELPNDESPWGANYFGCDEELDALFVEQLSIIDPEERAAVFHEITKIIHDKVYWLGMWDDPDYWIVSPRLTGVKFSGVSPLYNIMEWDVTE
ncbi:MAG: peptide ABC transporter substrate-binding protein [Anaerolineae bacterium]|nr:peptide ABC transporter substrate-binding protein [Anaerolineae bacterium]